MRRGPVRFPLTHYRVEIQSALDVAPRNPKEARAIVQRSVRYIVDSIRVGAPVGGVFTSRERVRSWDVVQSIRVGAPTLTHVLSVSHMTLKLVGRRASCEPLLCTQAQRTRSRTVRARPAQKRIERTTCEHCEYSKLQAPNPSHTCANGA